MSSLCISSGIGGSCLDGGTFGNTVMACDEKQRLLAIKIIQKDQLADQTARSEFRMEANLLRKLTTEQQKIGKQIRKFRTSVFPLKSDPFATKLCENAFRTIPNMLLFDVGKNNVVKNPSIVAY